MISYSTNWMGPINMDWFRDRGLTHMKTITVEEGSFWAKTGKYEVGHSFEVEEIKTHYSGGRIDIRGVPDEPWGLEYGLPVMHGEDWNALSDWLWDFKSEELVSYKELIAMFETDYGKKIRWADDNTILQS